MKNYNTEEINKVIHEGYQESKIIALNTVYIDLMGSLKGGVMLSQILYWINQKVKKGLPPINYCTNNQLMEETKLSADEIKCALMADVYLDKIGDDKRKRNRDEFPEVMQAYKANDHARQ